MQEIRCKKCNKKLGEINIEYARDSALKAGAKKELVDQYVNDMQNKLLNIKCPRCGEMNVRKENVKDGRERANL
jgi:phage FluMu protein Com